jgi:hypothetical protein
MKNIIKKILKEETLKQNLKQQVKDFGWKDAAELVDGIENLAKLGFNNNPMEFLNMFNDLEVVQSEEEKYWTLFRYEKGKNIMVYNRKYDEVYINYDVIWGFLQDGFGLKHPETQELTQEWLSETYNLRGVTTTWMHWCSHIMLSETYNLKI